MKDLTGNGIARRLVQFKGRLRPYEENDYSADVDRSYDCICML